MSRTEFKMAMGMFIENPELIPEEILDKYSYLRSGELKESTHTVFNDIPMWQYIAMQSELIRLLESIDIIE